MDAHRAGGRAPSMRGVGRRPPARSIRMGLSYPLERVQVIFPCPGGVVVEGRGGQGEAAATTGHGGCVAAVASDGAEAAERPAPQRRRGRGGGETMACVHANVSLKTTASETMVSMHANVSLRRTAETMACAHANVSLGRPTGETMASMHTFVSPCAACPFHLMSPRRHGRRSGASSARPGKAPTCPGNA